MKPVPNFILMNRRVMNHPWLNKRPEYVAAWLKILMLTNYETGIVNLTTVRRECRNWFTKSAWRHFVKRLLDDDMLRIKSRANKGETTGVITLCEVTNYGRYQGKNNDTANDTASSTAKHRQAQHEHHQRDTANSTANDTVYKEVKNFSSFQSSKSTYSSTKSTTPGDDQAWKLFDLLNPPNNPRLTNARRPHYQNQINTHGTPHVIEAARTTLAAHPRDPWAYYLKVIQNPDLTEEQYEPPELNQELLDSYRAVMEA